MEKLEDKTPQSKQAVLTAEAEKLAKEIPADRDLRVGCVICCTNFLHDPTFDWRANPTAQEVFNHLDVLAKERGWAYRFDGPHAVGFICPVCRKKQEENLTKPLPLYKASNKCTVCGFSKVSTRYCTGTNLTECRFGARPHLHRKCERCGYDWLEGCLNESAAT